MAPPALKVFSTAFAVALRALFIRSFFEIVLDRKANNRIFLVG
jgi:hypothetical protein